MKIKSLWLGRNFVSENPLLSPKNLAYDVLMKLEWLVNYQKQELLGPPPEQKLMFLGYF